MDSPISLDDVCRVAREPTGDVVGAMVAPAMVFPSGVQGQRRGPAPLDTMNAADEARPARRGFSNGGALPHPALGAWGNRH